MRSFHPLSRKRPPEFPFFTLLSWALLIFLIVISLATVLRMIEPFLSTIIASCLLVTLFYPVYRHLTKWLGGRESLASLASVILVFVAVLVPTGLLISAIVRQGHGVYQNARAWQEQGKWRDALDGERVRDTLNHPQMHRLLTAWGVEADDNGQIAAEQLAPVVFQATSRAFGSLANNLPALAGNLFGNAAMLLLNLAIAIFVMFYAFRDGPRMLAYMQQMIPMKRAHEQAILKQIRNVAKAVLVGTFLTAVTQAAVAMVGFAVVGMPALLWGVVLGLVSLIPVVGTAIVWVPMVVFLYLQGNTGQAIFLFFWSLLLVGTVDNFVRPFFMRGQSGMSTIVLFFALIGGIRLFGVAGLLYGPLIFSLCAVLLFIFRAENMEALHKLGK